MATQSLRISEVIQRCNLALCLYDRERIDVLVVCDAAAVKEKNSQKTDSR
jgi:hypothetical protein